MIIRVLLVFILSIVCAWSETPAPVVVPPVETVASPVKAFIVTEMNQTGFSWLDLGLERKESFLKPIEQAWITWMDLDPDLKGQTSICDETCLTFLRKWEEKSPEEVAKLPESDFVKSHWIKVVYDLKRVSPQEFRWQGRATLIEIKTKRALLVHEIEPQVLNTKDQDQKTANSQLASAMYRSPLSMFQAFKPILKKDVSKEHVQRLVITGHRHLSDLQSYLDSLKSRGNQLSLGLKLDSIRQNQVEVLAFYQGEEKSFSDLLSQVNELKLSKSYTISNEFNGVHYIIKMVVK